MTLIPLVFKDGARRPEPLGKFIFFSSIPGHCKQYHDINKVRKPRITTPIPCHSLHDAGGLWYLQNIEISANLNP